MGLFDFWKKKLTPPPVQEDKDILIDIDSVLSVYIFNKYGQNFKYLELVNNPHPTSAILLNTKFSKEVYGCFYEVIDIFINGVYEEEMTTTTTGRNYLDDPNSIKNIYEFDINNKTLKCSSLGLHDLVFVRNKENMIDFITGRTRIFNKSVKVPEKARQAHTYIIGASKSGKSELIKDLIFSDFEKENKSVILIEPHGDLAEQVAKLKGKNNEKLVYIDFTLDPEKTPVLNPFDISDRTPENIEIQAQALIDAFEDILGAEFSTQMEELLGATIRTLMHTGKGDFWELRRFMDDENNSDLVTAGKASPNPKDRLFFNDGSFNQQSYKPTKNSLKSKIGTYLGYAVFRNFTTGKSTIDLKKLTDGKMWVIINLSKGNIGKKVSPILGRFVIASLQNIILQRAKTTHRTPVYLYIDEFQNYTSETIEEIFSESRKYGFHLTVAHQNTGQLLGKMRDLIFSNTSVKIIGRNDTDQLKKLSNQILVEFGKLDKLTTGKFYMRVEKNEAKQVQVGTKLLDNKYSMTAQEWEQVKAEQLEKYYTKIQEHEPPTISEPTSDKFDFNPSDTV